MVASVVVLVADLIHPLDGPHHLVALIFVEDWRTFVLGYLFYTFKPIYTVSVTTNADMSGKIYVVALCESIIFLTYVHQYLPSSVLIVWPHEKNLIISSKELETFECQDVFSR